MGDFYKAALASTGESCYDPAMIPKKGNIIELQVEGVAHGGQGVARVDGLVVFVKGAIPGDRVLALVTRKKKDYAEARMTELLDPSLDRVEAPCPYSGYCGGCQWQHVAYERQLVYKKGLIEEAISRIGALSGIPIHDVIPSDKAFAYRNKMEFSFSGRRWLLPQEMAQGQTDRGFALGLHVPGTFHKVLDMKACLLQEERGNEILREVRRYTEDSGIPAYDLKSHEGFWRFLALRHAAHFDEWMVNIITSEFRRDAVEPLAEILCDRFPNVKTVVNNVTKREAAVALGESEIVLSGPGTISDRIGPFTFQISANSFFQTNTLGAERLYRTVAEWAELGGAETVLDLYSGTGTIPIFLAGRSKEVIGMEIMQSAIQDAEINCRVNGIENCRFVLGDIRENLKSLRLQPDVMIIDPPRAGMHKDVLAGVM
ncbi:MAG: 23S rRNA (uracil(1939)-C(5))-methyltransferase RlmD, partial [Desulfobacterales bacterium]|nr:23S rRNA (uracil(1939)-C(5))-methyltransferase RlmD [Desulfobacterales bacterium]